MSDTKYQVFLSSTFLDLQKERNVAVSAIMRMGCIPVGMELFPASDQTQWGIIQRALEDTDYYVLLVGGRYGSLLDHRSYTEAEYDLALSAGVPVVPLLCTDFETRFRHLDTEDENQLNLLKTFRTRLAGAHNCQYWSSDAELGLLLYQGLHDAMNRQPRKGWVRADKVSDQAALEQIIALQKLNDELKGQVNELEARSPPEAPNLSQGDDLFEVHGSYQGEYSEQGWSRLITWNEILRFMGPRMSNWSSLSNIQDVVREIYYFNPSTRSFNPVRDYSYRSKVVKEDIYIILNQFKALGLIESKVLNTTGGTSAEFWRTTPAGDRAVSSLLAVKRG